MKILAIDTSTKFLSIAITNDGGVLASFSDRGKLRHSELLMPAIDKTLKKTSLKLKDIDAIALSIGPGSFTGLRIGVATCKAINMATGIPIVAVPTLDVIAQNFLDEKERMLSPLIDGKKQKVYACLYRKTTPGLRNLERVTDYMLADINDVLKKIDEPTVVFGDAAELYREHCRKNSFVRISSKGWLPKAEVVGKIGLTKARKNEFADPDKLVPMYLHSKYCQVKI